MGRTAISVFIVALFVTGASTFAADPTDVDMSWEGSGTVGATVVAGSTLATTNFQSLGDYIKGRFTAKYDVGGGPYGGNSYATAIDAEVTNGIIEFYTDRGALGYNNSAQLETGGQQCYSFVGTGAFGTGGWIPGTGWASMKTRTTSAAVFKKDTGVSYTGLNTNTYGWVSGGEDNFAANADLYTIIRKVTAGQPSSPDLRTYVQFYAQGSGEAHLDVGWAKAGQTGRDNAVLGPTPKCGYYFGWNQRFEANADGFFEATGQGANSVTLYDVTQIAGADPSTSWFHSVGVLAVSGSGLVTTGDGTPGSAFMQYHLGHVAGTPFSFKGLTMESK